MSDKDMEAMLKEEDERFIKAVQEAAVKPSPAELALVKEQDEKFIELTNAVIDPTGAFTDTPLENARGITRAQLRTAAAAVSLIGPSLMFNPLAFLHGPIRRSPKPQWKDPDTSATGSISKDERDRRNKLKKQAEKAKKKNRK